MEPPFQRKTQRLHKKTGGKIYGSKKRAKEDEIGTG
jgi:hypothetical protein